MTWPYKVAVISAVAALLEAAYCDEVTRSQRERWKNLACNAVAEYDYLRRLINGLQELAGVAQEAAVKLGLASRNDG